MVLLWSSQYVTFMFRPCLKHFPDEIFKNNVASSINKSKENQKTADIKYQPIQKIIYRSSLEMSFSRIHHKLRVGPGENYDAKCPVNITHGGAAEQDIIVI